MDYSAYCTQVIVAIQKGQEIINPSLSTLKQKANKA